MVCSLIATFLVWRRDNESGTFKNEAKEIIFGSSKNKEDMKVEYDNSKEEAEKGDYDLERGKEDSKCNGTNSCNENKETKDDNKEKTEGDNQEEKA